MRIQLATTHAKMQEIGDLGQWGVGFLSNKHGPIVNNAPIYIDNAVFLEFNNSVVGRSIVIKDGVNNTPIACCNINLSKGVPVNRPAPPPPPQQAMCFFWSDVLHGHVSFRSGRHSYGVDMKVDIRFKGESVNELFTYYIREFGLSYNSYAFKKGCSDSGATFDLVDHIGPDSNALYTWPQFVRAEIGDLSGKHGRIRGDQSTPLFYQDSQIQLAGPHSIMGRSIVILDLKGKDVACCTISAVPLQELEDWDHYDMDHHHHEDQNDFEPIPEEILKQLEGGSAWGSTEISLVVFIAIVAAAVVGMIYIIVTGKGDKVDFTRKAKKWLSGDKVSSAGTAKDFDYF
eukprot:TRINITY_DN9217_c0_g1_i2.p1 TRINITY_DN9217_c0_g1~~TRINITY_DN9217_c0_g1_i2.p1  ORF type:complete len:344 (-),score=57.28 TRINITY_DN9217_c0_g1_i2:7-1038(-)